MDPRIARAQEQLRRERLDAFVLTHPHDVLYTTGYASIMERWSLQEPIAAAIVVQGGPTILCLPEANIALLAVLAERGRPDRADEIRVFELLNFCEMARVLDPSAKSTPLRRDATEMYATRVKGRCEPELLSCIAATLRDHELGAARIGFDDLRVGHAVRRLEGCRRIEVHDALDAMIRARVVKTPDELAAFRRIGKRADKIIQYAAAQLRPGIAWDAVQRSVAGYMTQLDVAPVDERAMLFGGAYAGEFTPEMFRTSHEGALEPGDIVVLETLGSCEDFWIDINRTATIGPPRPEFEKLHGIVRDAFLTMIDAMTPGTNTGAVQKLGLEYLRKHGVATPEKLIAVAHGVGHMPVEIPVPYPSLGIRGARGFELEEGMVISLDCLYFGAELGPCHMENVFIIDAGGAESTYATPLELMGPR
jgi:Xaa-Pro aminopeptidase